MKVINFCTTLTVDLKSLFLGLHRCLPTKLKSQHRSGELRNVQLPVLARYCIQEKQQGRIYEHVRFYDHPYERTKTKRVQSLQIFQTSKSAKIILKFKV